MHGFERFDARFDHLGSTLMSVGGLSCKFNLPKALESRRGADGEEDDQGLPPYAERVAFLVDEFPACPEGWMRSSTKEASYMVPVKAGHGLWLDFNTNGTHDHDLAVRISMQGICAITGLPTADRVRLEQYRENCPVHNVPFEADRFCPVCKFKWPAQNYLATTGTPRGSFWLDGFRAKDGRVRQFVFTEETARGVAAQIIGEKRVFSIGIAFYQSKEPRPRPAPAFRAYGMNGADEVFSLGGGPIKAYGLRGSSATRSIGSSYACRRMASAPRLEVAAGARIAQKVHPDPKDLDYWQDTPAGTIYVNYVDEETARAILAAGRKDLTAGGEGFLNGLKVGNDPGRAES